MSIINALEGVQSLQGDTLNRKWVLDVNLNHGISGTPAWVRLRGVTDQSPSEDPTTQDSSTYDDHGWKSSTVTAMGWGWEITVARKPATDGSYDTAQEYLRHKSLTMGPDNIAHVRAYEWNGVNGPRVQAYEGKVGVAYAEQGGDMAGLSSAKITLTGQGRRYDIAHPAGPVAWAATTAVVAGDQRLSSDGSVIQALNSGTTGATAPTDTTVQAGTSDGNVKWKIVSSDALAAEAGVPINDMGL